MQWDGRVGSGLRGTTHHDVMDRKQPMPLTYFPHLLSQQLQGKNLPAQQHFFYFMESVKAYGKCRMEMSYAVTEK